MTTVIIQFKILTTHLYQSKSCTCSLLRATRMPRILLKNDAKRGFRGGLPSKNAYNLLRGSFAARCSLMVGISHVKSSQAILGYLNRVFSSRSAGGSTVANVTNCSITSGRHKLQTMTTSFSLHNNDNQNNRQERQSGLSYKSTSFLFCALHSCKISSSSISS